MNVDTVLIFGWVAAVVGYGGVFAWLIWGAFAPPVEDEEAAR